MLAVCLRVTVGVAAATVAVITVRSALRTMVVPRGVPDRLTRVVFRVMDSVAGWRSRRARSYRQLDRRTAGLGLGLLFVLLATWLTGIWLAGAGIQWALTQGPATQVFAGSAAALTTIGAPPGGDAAAAAGDVEAVLGLGLLALVIGYLPSLYAAFSRREALITKLAMRTGLPPAGPAILTRLWRSAGPQDLLDGTWRDWENWFADVSESHTTFPSLAFFRSPQTAKSWITSAGAVLDAAALALAVTDADPGPAPRMCLHAGITALRHIADFHGIGYDLDPAPAPAPITIQRHEMLAACQAMAAVGVPVVGDLDAAYDRFCGRRLAYDRLLLALCAYIYAPYAPWSSDRVTGPRHRPPILRVGAGSTGRVHSRRRPETGSTRQNKTAS